MGDLMTLLVGAPFDLSAWMWAWLGLAVFAVLAWLASLRLKNVGIVDSLWSLMFLISLAIYQFNAESLGWRGNLLWLLVGVWALRLSLYIAWRNHGQPEDRRYQKIRSNNQPNFAFKSLYIVFGLQATLAWLISLPLLAAASGQTAFGWLDALGICLWVIGMTFEVVGDAQLARFRSNPDNDGKVLNSGLWRFTRHPNYFGECVLWWGYFLLAASAGASWTIIAPLLMTLLLLRVSGVSLLEKDIGERRPEYRNYIKRTNAFVPGRVAKLMLVCGVIMIAPARAEEPSTVGDQVWRFQVYVDEKAVGFHEFRMQQRGDRLLISSLADFEYKLMFVRLYHYQHENQEVWQNGCLSHIQSQTDANGKYYSVSGEKISAGFEVEGSQGTELLDDCVMSFAYWNPKFLQARRLLNSQNGEYLDVSVSLPSKGTLMVQGREVMAQRFQLTGEKLKLDIWYSEQGAWLGLQSQHENGRTLRYELLTKPTVAPVELAQS